MKVMLNMLQDGRRIRSFREWQEDSLNGLSWDH